MKYVDTTLNTFPRLSAALATKPRSLSTAPFLCDRRGQFDRQGERSSVLFLFRY